MYLRFHDFVSTILGASGLAPFETWAKHHGGKLAGSLIFRFSVSSRQWPATAVASAEADSAIEYTAWRHD
jgi:hypothetical protein